MIGLRNARRHKQPRYVPLAPGRGDRAEPIRTEHAHPSWCDCPAHRAEPGPADRQHPNARRLALVLLGLALGMIATAGIDATTRRTGLQVMAGEPAR